MNLQSHFLTTDLNVWQDLCSKTPCRILVVQAVVSVLVPLLSPFCCVSLLSVRYSFFDGSPISSDFSSPPATSAVGRQFKRVPIALASVLALKKSLHGELCTVSVTMLSHCTESDANDHEDDDSEKHPYSPLGSALAIKKPSTVSLCKLSLTSCDHCTEKSILVLR